MIKVGRTRINSYDDDMSIGGSKPRDEEDDGSINVTIALNFSGTWSQKKKIEEFIANELINVIQDGIN